jgi:hypothetical protein
MRDWTGTRIREDSLRFRCRACNAVVGAECTDKEGKPIVAFPAHACRMADANKEIEQGIAIDTPVGMKPPWRGAQAAGPATGGER